MLTLSLPINARRHAFHLFFWPFLVAVLWSKVTLEPGLGPRVRPVHGVDALKVGLQADFLKHYCLGFQQFVGAISWIHLLQAASERPIAGQELSWEFTQLNNITELDPNFDLAYGFGSVFLSVFRRDNLGAKRILEKWIARRPYSWRAHYLLGYHLYAEMGDYRAAAPYILKAGSLPQAPGWLSALGIRLLSETGALFQSLKLSVELYEGLESSESQRRLKMRIRNLNYAIQKSNWEKAVVSYQEKYRRDPMSLDQVKDYAQGQMRELSSILDPGNLHSELLSLLAERFDFYFDREQRQVRSRISPEQLGLERIGVFKKEAQ